MCRISRELHHLFTLRTCCSTHHRGLVRFRISDRKFVNHTTEMILWSMILNHQVFSKPTKWRATRDSSWIVWRGPEADCPTYGPPPTAAAQTYNSSSDRVTFIGQQESLQLLSCLCDTHLLRSVFKLFKLGRIDKHCWTWSKLKDTNSMQPLWTSEVTECIGASRNSAEVQDCPKGKSSEKLGLFSIGVP